MQVLWPVSGTSQHQQSRWQNRRHQKLLELEATVQLQVVVLILHPQSLSWGTAWLSLAATTAALCVKEVQPKIHWILQLKSVNVALLVKIRKCVLQFQLVRFFKIQRHEVLCLIVLVVLKTVIASCNLVNRIFL